MKVGIVVPYSWSFWGAVVEHAELQAQALRDLGVETRTIMGNDPPGQFTRALHPRVGRDGPPPPDVIPVGRSAIVPANASLPNIILGPRSVGRLRRTLERERFDLLHVHEPLTPVLSIGALALTRSPVVATFHASGDLGWAKLGMPVWGFLLDRIDVRIAVSEQARLTAWRYSPAAYEVIPNGVLIPPQADPSGREDRILFVGRQEARKGLPVLLRAWPEIRRRTGTRLRVIGADPLAVRLLIARERISDEGIDVLGFLSQERLTAELLSAKAMVAPSLGGESFGMVLTRAFACATPVVASDIDGYRDVMSPETGMAVPPGDAEALIRGVVDLLADEDRRCRFGEHGRRQAEERYSWHRIGTRLVDVYERVLGRVPAAA
ncbi:MAG TPA: glycosyltransferase family 4 protein [Gaiellaceae bacterium]|jgi:phosphatidylinositol alpha-mannosyltransferase|nr:glycosyltransferase family 4 protein [Gaiellaceae bacterium]